MAGSIAEELYPETSRILHRQSDITLRSDNKLVDSNDCNEDDPWDVDDNVWDTSYREYHKTYDLDREWRKRHDHFHTSGYREGIIKGKEDSAQEGFNGGFKESAPDGYKWGIVRGVTSALACLPDDIKEKLVQSEEQRNRLRSLHEEVHSISTTDALKSFYDNIQTDKPVQQSENASGSGTGSVLDQISENSLLEKYFRALQLLLSESPTIDVSLEIDHHSSVDAVK